MRKQLSTLFLAGGLVVSAAGTVAAQQRPVIFPPPPPSGAESAPSTGPRDERQDPDRVSGLKTTVEFEILSGSPGAGLDAQRWVQALGDLGVTVRVRGPKAADELGVTERVQGTLRWVSVVAELDPRGRLSFGDRMFHLHQTSELKEWVDELKLYGALGKPEGQPLWGLTYDQFNSVFRGLGELTTQEVAGMPLEESLAKLPLPTDMPIRYHSSATKQFEKRPATAPVRPRVQGLTGGTALAAVLADYGLAFRPLRTPAGSLELVVEPLAALKEPWPIGWEPEKDASRGKMAPGLFRMQPVGFDELPLPAVINAVAQAGEIPVVVNAFSAAEKGIHIDQIRVSYPKKNAAYMMVLSSVLRRSRLTLDMRLDEAGTPFVYVTAFVPRTVIDLSPAESD